MRRSYHSSSSPDVPVPTEKQATATSAAVHTLIFVDIDGVLNIGVRDEAGGAPLLFSDMNLEHARRIERSGRPHSEGACVEKIVSVSKRALPHGDTGTYARLASTGARHVSSILVDRLVQIIRACGDSRTVVLASSWRRPQHEARCLDLENEITKRIGKPWTFDARTPIRDDSSPEERLRCIGDHLSGFQCPARSRLRVLVLEDFFITPVNGCWACDGVRMRSAEDVERYLARRYNQKNGVTVRLVHPFEQWVTPRGTVVQVGGGLTLNHLCDALNFLGAGDDCRFCERRESQAVQAAGDANGFEKGPAGEGSPAEPIGRARSGSRLSSKKLSQKCWMDVLTTSMPWLPIPSMWHLQSPTLEARVA